VYDRGRLSLFVRVAPRIVLSHETQRRVRRGTFYSEHERIEALQQYMETHNEDPRRFEWRATDDQILATVRWNRSNMDLADASH